MPLVSTSEVCTLCPAQKPVRIIADHTIRYQLGSYDDLEEAARVVAAFRQKHHGELQGVSDAHDCA